MHQKLKELNAAHIKRQGYKWYALLFTCFMVFLMMYYFLIPVINYVFVKSADNSSLLDPLKEWIPDIKMENAITDDLLLFSWDINNRQPYIISKKTVKTTTNELYKDLDSIQEATFLSACNPAYFKPCAKGDNGKIKDRVFISGDSWAVSPAMYTYSYALTNNLASKDNTRVVSIGSIKERADKIPANIGIFEWISRVSSLQGPSKLFS